VELPVLLYGCIAAAVEVVASALVVLRRSWPRAVQEHLLALGAGFILALVFLELIPESIEAVGDRAPIFMLLGYAFLHFFEHTIVGHLHFGEETHHEVMVSRAASLSTVGGLMVHAFFDGFAISAGLQFDFYIGLLVFLAVLLHKIPEGLTVATVMLAARFRRSVALATSAAVGGATILGAVTVVLLVQVDAEVLGLCFAFSAGVATYVGASDLVPEINHSRNRLMPVLVFGGMVLFYLGTLVLSPLAGH
jgi:zinc transporter ZupT